jgi:hypothetical protein
MSVSLVRIVRMNYGGLARPVGLERSPYGASLASSPERMAIEMAWARLAAPSFS